MPPEARSRLTVNEAWPRVREVFEQAWEAGWFETDEGRAYLAEQARRARRAEFLARAAEEAEENLTLLRDVDPAAYEAAVKLNAEMARVDREHDLGKQFAALEQAVAENERRDEELLRGGRLEPEEREIEVF